MKQRDVLERVLSSIRYHTSRKIVVAPAVPGRPASRGKPAVKASPAVHQLAIEQLLVRAQAAVLIGASASARRDGYASTTPGNGNPGSGKGGRPLMAIKVRDDGDELDGQVDLVPTSSTERAAIDPVPAADPVGRVAGEINQLLHTIERSLEHLDNALVRFDRLRSASELAEPPMCAVAQMRGMAWDREWEPWRTTDFARQLESPFDAPRPVCRFVYWFVYNNRRLPDAMEMRQHLERQTVKLHEAAAK